MMFRLKLALIIGGAVLAYFGVQEYRLSMGTSTEPAKVDLAACENGETLENNHVLIGKHVADYNGSVYEYEEGNGKVTHTYYPIISDDHPFFEQLAALYEKYGENIESAPESEWPSIDTFKVLIKTKRFKTVDSIPDGLGDQEKIQGLVINLVDSMDREEEKLIKQSFPKLNMDDVWIVEDGRKPSSAVSSLGMIGGGGLLSFLGMGLFFVGRESES